MLWYLTEAVERQETSTMKEELSYMINETEMITELSSESILAVDVSAHREKVNKLLRKANLLGADLRGALLIAADIRGADLSGADFNGSDLRDTDLRGTNLTNSIFITQAQINTAKGDYNTKLPSSLSRPKYWGK